MHLPHGGVVRIVMQHFVICIFIWVGFLLEIVALRVKSRQIFVNFRKQLKKGCKRRTLSVLKTMPTIIAIHVHFGIGMLSNADWSFPWNREIQTEILVEFSTSKWIRMAIFRPEIRLEELIGHGSNHRFRKFTVFPYTLNVKYALCVAHNL